MRLFLLSLVIVSTPFASTDLVLASAESKRTNALESDSVQRYLRANSTSEQEEEERQFDNQQLLIDIEKFLPRLPGFSPYDKIKRVAKVYFKMMEYDAISMGRPPPSLEDLIMSSYYLHKLVEEIHFWTSLRSEKYIDIALYLVLLEKVGGSIREAAKNIENGMQWGLEPAIASRMEDGQFHLWSHILKTEDRVRADIFESRLDIVWRKRILERFRDFLANEEKRHIPGLEEASTSRF